MSDDKEPLMNGRIALDIETILAINERLRMLDDVSQPLERIHGRFTVEIVKGQFHRIEVAPSYLLNDKKRARRSA